MVKILHIVLAIIKPICDVFVWDNLQMNLLFLCEYFSSYHVPILEAIFLLDLELYLLI